VLSGNRNFEGRIHSQVRANYLMSPPLVVAYALAGTMEIDLLNEPLGHDPNGAPVFLRDVWPNDEEIERAVSGCVRPEMFVARYEKLFEGDATWTALGKSGGASFGWAPQSSYVREPPFVREMSKEVPSGVEDIRAARVLAVLGDSITTDHISPAGSIRADSPAGRYLVSLGVEPRDFNSYGSRRGNHEVMVRGTFANVRLRNRLAGGREGGFTTHLPSGEVMSIYDAAMRYRDEGTPLVILAGKEYGSGSSRDWAAKGPLLLGVRAVLAESFERIHRSNLVGMGILPLQLPASIDALGLDGHETFEIVGFAEALSRGFRDGRTVRVRARKLDSVIELDAVARIDTQEEAMQMLHGGILPYVVRRLLGAANRTDAPLVETAAILPVAEAAATNVDESSIESFPASDVPAY
jgi:aconitate hydratase